MPWLKRIDRQTGAVTRTALPDGGIHVQRGKRSPNPLGLRQFKGRVRVFAEAGGPASADGASVWCASPADFAAPSSAGSQMIPGAPPAPRVVTLEHGSALDAGESGYLFLDRAEHRDAQLEAAACASVEKVEPWAAWLEAQGDPFALPLREMLAGREFAAGRQRWWLEGCDRGMAALGAAFEMRGGFLRRAELGGGTLPIDLQVLHLMGLRVARGLEDLTIDLSGFLPASFWLPFARSSFWDMAPWPASLRVVRLSRGAAKPIELTQSAAVLRRNPRMRGISIEA